MADRITGILNLLKGIGPVSKAENKEVIIPTRAELEKLPEKDLQRILEQLTEATTVDRRELMRGALGALADVSSIGRLTKIIDPVVETTEKVEEAIPSFFPKIIDDIDDIFADASVQRQLDEAEEYADDFDEDMEFFPDSDDSNMGLMETWMYLKIPEDDLPYLEYFENASDDVIDAIDDLLEKQNITKNDLANYMEDNNMAPSSEDLKHYGLEEYDHLLTHKEHRDLTEVE